MKKIPLTQGREAIVDDEDFEKLSEFKWFVSSMGKSKTLFYAGSHIEKKSSFTLMHRFILNSPKGKNVDHIDGNGLNNQRSNLRLCTQSENIRNSKQKKSKSGYRGVFWLKSNKKWMAYISHERKSIYIGSFSTAKEAAMARNKKAIEIHGKFAVLNQC